MGDSVTFDPGEDTDDGRDANDAIEGHFRQVHDAGS
jgi:hypothetical protein